MIQKELHRLLQGCKSNNRESQEAIYKYYFDEMFTTCKRYVQDAHEALTILNDGFLKVFKNIGKYDHELGEFKPWIKTIIINTAIDYLRTKKKGTQLVHIDSSVDHGTEEWQLHTQWDEEEICYHMRELPSVTRTVLNLFAFDGHSYKEISERLGITQATCRWHVAEARKKLRRSMQLTPLKGQEV